MTTVSPLAPDVIERLKQLQDSDRNVTVDEILTAANLNHLVQPSVQPEKSVSSSLAERRRLPVSPEKLKLCNQITTSRQLSQDMILKRLEEENAKLPPQVNK